jgi:hypothetical protein
MILAEKTEQTELTEFNSEKPVLAAEQRTGVAHCATVGKIPTKPQVPDGAKEKSLGLSHAPSGAGKIRNKPTHGCTVDYFLNAAPRLAENRACSRGVWSYSFSSHENAFGQGEN